MVLTRSSALAQPLLGPEREEALIRAWQTDRDERARDAIVRSYMRLCYGMAARYSRNEEHVADLAQEGVWGILEALNRYDPSRGVKFSTYSRFWIRNFISAAVARVCSPVSVPSRVYMDARMGRIPEGFNEAAIAASKPQVDLDAPGDGKEVLSRSIEHDGPDPEEAAIAASLQESYAAAVSVAFEALSERERDVVRRRRLSDLLATLEEIAMSHGVTRERIRQVEKAAMEKLEAALVGSGFDPKAHFLD